MTDPSRQFLLVDLGGTRVRAALGTTSDRLHGRLEERTYLVGGPEGTIEQIVRMAREVAAATRSDRSAISGLVISTPGPLDHRTGVVHDAPNMPGWHRVAIRDELTARLGWPVTALNDANAAALGEFSYGAGRGLHNLVYLTISTGIGGGVVVDGELLEGTSGTAGEIGHMCIDRRGPPCPCGNIGCLEVLASGTSIARRFRQRLAQGARSTVTESITDREVTAADVSRGALEGDRLAAEVFRDAADAIGLGVVNCIHIFNPEIVVLGGGVTQAGPLLFEPVREMVQRHAMAVPRRGVTVVPAELRDDAGLYGALAAGQARLS